MTKVVVTGGAGFIGSHLVDRLIQENNEVVIIDNLSTGFARNVNKKGIFHNIDIRDYEKLLDATKSADCLFHLAALPRIQKSIHDPLITSEVNIQGTINVLEASRQNGIKRVIFTSSSSIYGSSKALPLKEGQVPAPTSPYALQKVVAEKYCHLYSNLYGLDTVILRLFSVYGSRQNGKDEYATAVGKFLYLKSQKKALPIYGSGKQKRDFTHINDVVEACISAINAPKGTTINICSGHPISILKLAEMIGGEKKFLPIREGEALNNWGDNSRAKRLLKWIPVESLSAFLS